MKHLFFLLLLTQTVFYSRAANGAEQHKTGIQGLIKAANPKNNGKNAQNALEYLLKSENSRTLKTNKKIRQTLQDFNVDKNSIGGALKKLWSEKGIIYKFEPLKQPVQHQTAKPPVIHGGGKKMIQKDKAGAARAPKKDLEQLQRELEEAEKCVSPGQKFVHHKNSAVLYTINSISTNVLTQRPIVQYTDGTHEWARDYDDFISLVDGVPRFSLVK